MHGDLWHEHIGISKETGELMIFDGSTFYGHNEYEIGTWRNEFVAFDELQEGNPATLPTKRAGR